MSAERLSRRHRHAGRQRGSLLLECMVVAIVSLVLAIWAAHEWAQRARALQARSLAVWMEIARDAADAFLTRHAGDLAAAGATNALAGKGFANWTAPRWEELRAAGLLAGGWQAAGPLRTTLGLRVIREGTCPGAACRVWAVVHAQPGLRTAGNRVDESLVAEWLQAARGQGLVVWPHRPDVLSGAGVRLPVPEAGSPVWSPGVVALAARPAGPMPAAEETDTPDAEASYLRVRDPRDPDFQGNATVQGVVRSGTRLATRDSLLLEKGWGVGKACTPEGALGRALDGVGILSCQKGLWTVLSRPAGGGYMVNTRRGCVDAMGISSANPVTKACSCPTGYTMARIAETGSVSGPEGLTVGYLCVPLK